MRKINERDLYRIVKRTINEKQELNEALNCNDFGADDCTIDCCRDREGGDGIGRKMGSIAGCTTGGPCTPFDACADGTSECVGSVRQPNDAEREIDRLKEVSLNRIVNRVINERKAVHADGTKVGGKTYVCVNGNCYDWDKTSDAVQCEGHGGPGDTEYACYGRKGQCKRNCN